LPEGRLLTNDGAGNILRGWGGFLIFILIAVEEKSRDNAETRRAQRRIRRRGLALLRRAGLKTSATLRKEERKAGRGCGSD
jgi:hypothetical protein